MRAKEIAKDGISYEDRERLITHIFNVQSCPDCQLPDKWSFTLCDRHWDESEELEDLIDVDKLFVGDGNGMLSEYWDERIEERRKPKKKEAVTMQELKDNLKKEKVTAEEHIQSAKNCIDCVGATVEPKGFGENQERLCEYHKELLRGDGHLQRVLVDMAWGSYYRDEDPGLPNPYYIERSSKSVSVTMALADLAAAQLEAASERILGAFNALAGSIGDTPAQDTPEVAAFRSSMYGTFVRDSRR